MGAREVSCNSALSEIVAARSDVLFTFGGIFKSYDTQAVTTDFEPCTQLTLHMYGCNARTYILHMYFSLVQFLIIIIIVLDDTARPVAPQNGIVPYNMVPYHGQYHAPVPAWPATPALLYVLYCT